MTSSTNDELPVTVREAMHFASAQAAPIDAPRILLVTYHFPPDPMIGGVRWQEMARYLTERGWAVDVIARDFRHVPNADPARLARFAKGIRIFCAADREPLVGRVHKAVWPVVRRLRRGQPQDKRGRPAVLSRAETSTQGGGRAVVRAYFAWLEFARPGNWAQSAARLGIMLARHSHYDAVISSGPPHMAHEGARRIAERIAIPLVIDLRDPWSIQRRLPESLASPVWYRLARRYERLAVHDASMVILNAEGCRDGMQSEYPEHAFKLEVIRNGCDDVPLPATRRDGRFTIRFAGSIYSDRDPRLAFRAAARVIAALGLSPSQFAFEFVGHMGDMPVAEMAREEGVGDYVHLGGFLSREAVLEFLAGATMLLSLPMDEEDFSIPGKIYEYMRFEAWMLVLAHTSSATEQLLRGTSADVVDPTDVDAIAAVLRHRYEQFVSGEMPQPVRTDGRFDRVTQAQKLLDSLTRVRDARGGPRNK